MRFTGGGDAENYTFGTNAASLVLLVHVLPFTMLLGSMLAFFFLCTCSDNCCPLQSVCLSSRRYCALQILIVQVGISPFDAILGGKQPFYSAAGVHTFSTAGLGITLPVGVIVTRSHKNNLAAISTIVGSTVPLLCGRWGNCLVWTLYYPLPVNTAAILQQPALL